MVKGLRWIIFGVPVFLVLLTLWSAKQAKNSRLARHENFVIASSAQDLVTLNPFQAVSEVDIELKKLLHDSLIRSDRKGGLQPGLFEKWEWNQTSSLWFANEQIAKTAETKIRAMTPEQWQQCSLLELEVQDSQLSLEFSQAGSVGPNLLLQQIVDLGPLPVEQWRVELASDSKHHHEFFLQNALEKAQIKRARILSEQEYILEVSGETVRLMEELQLYFQNHPQLKARISVLSRQAMMHQLEFQALLREDAKFQNGDAVTLEDVESTLRFVYSKPWLSERMEAWRLVDSIQAISAKHLKIRFHEIYGPSIQIFVDLPILQKKWIDQYGAAINSGINVFRQHPPSGTGKAYIEQVRERSISVALTDEKIQWPKRLLLLFGQTARAIRTGYEMDEIDAFWPLSVSIEHIAKEEEVKLSRQTSLNRLMLLWNTRKAPLDRVDVRHALGLALNREVLIQEMLDGQGGIHDGIFYPSSWLSSNPESEKFNLEEARKKLYALGWVRNEEGFLVRNQEALTFHLLTVEGNAERRKLANLLTEQWKELGVKVIVEELPLNEIFGNRLHQRNFDAALIGLNFETQWDQFALWHSSQSVRGLNFTGLISPEVDSKLISLRQEFDPKTIQSLTRDLERELIRNHPFLTIFCAESTLAVRKRSKGNINENSNRLMGGNQ